MAAATARSFSPAITSFSTPAFKPNKPINSLLFPSSFKPFSSSATASPTLTFTRLRSCSVQAVSPKRVYRVLAVSGTNPDAELSDSNRDATVDIKLPRRSLQVQFTCNLCGERTKRLINRLAYERGLVFVQCAGCLKHHKLVDNLGLVVDYDLREEISIEPDTDQV